MGTNFYFSSASEKCPECDRSDDDCFRSGHIGKRSAAGGYCWDCKQTLVIGGESKVHTNNSQYDSCPECGKKPGKHSGDAAYVELGFKKYHEVKRKGVGSCSSFTYAKDPKEVEKKLSSGEKVEDEYGRTFTPKEFRDILSGCPIKFYLIGQEFS